MAIPKRIGEPKEVSRHRMVLRNCNRQQLEITASHSILYTRFKERLYTLPPKKTEQMQTGRCKRKFGALFSLKQMKI